MALSSSDISNIIQGQINSFSSSAQYANALSQGGGAMPQPVPPMEDKRNAMMEAASMANMASRAPSFAAGAVGMGAMMGMAPRMLDPFTSAMHAGSKGMARMGIGGAVGMGAAAFGGVAAGGMALSSLALDPFQQGGQGRAALNSQMGGLFPGANMNQLGQTSQAIEQMNRQGAGTLGELTSLANQGVAQGDISTTNISAFQASFQKLVSTARQIATTLNTSITEGNAALQHVRGLGVSTQDAPGFIGQMRSMGQASGQAPDQMMGAAQAGADMALQLGLSRGKTATGMMTQSAMAGLAQRSGAVEGMHESSLGTMQRGAMTFLGGRAGSRVLAAAFDPETGGLNQDVASQIASGAMDQAQIRKMAAQTMKSHRDAFGARRGELAGEFLSEFGAQGIAAPLRSATAGSANPQMMMQKITGGMNRRDIQMLDQLAAATPQLRQQLTTAAQEGFREGQQENIGLGTAISQSIEQLTKPLKDKFRRMGAQMTQTVMESMQDVTRMFVNQPPPGADPAMLNRFFQDMQMGGAQAGRMGGAMGGAAGGGGPGQYAPTQSGAAMGGIPPAFRMGSFSPGTSPFDFPDNGLSLQQHNPTLSKAAYGMGAAGAFKFATGKNPLSAPGRAVSGLGSFVGGLAPKSTGKWGMGGRGFVGSGVAATGLALKGVGGLAKLGSRFVSNPAVAAVALAANYFVNDRAESRRQSGEAPRTAGSITGRNAQLLELMGDVGAINLQSQGTSGQDGSIMSAFSAAMGRDFGAIPLTGHDGRRQEILPGELEKGHAFLSSTPSQDVVDRLGGDGKMQQEIQMLVSQGGDLSSITKILSKRHGIDKKVALQFLVKYGHAGQLTEHGGGGAKGEKARGKLAKELVGIADDGGSSGTGHQNSSENKALRAFGNALGSKEHGVQISTAIAELDRTLPVDGTDERIAAREAAITKALGGIDKLDMTQTAREIAKGGHGSKAGRSAEGDMAVVMKDALVDVQQDLYRSKGAAGKGIRRTAALTGSDLGPLADYIEGTAEGGDSGVEGVSDLLVSNRGRQRIGGMLDEAGLSDPESLHEIVATSGNTPQERQIAGVAARKGRIAAISKASGKRGGAAAEKFIEGITGVDNIRLSKASRDFLAGRGGRTHQADVWAQAQAVHRLANTRFENSPHALATMKATILDAARAKGSGDESGLLAATNRMASFEGQTNVSSAQRGGLTVKASELGEAVDRTITALDKLTSRYDPK